MKAETDGEDLLPEYDFSGGERGRYTDRLDGTRDRLLESAAALDRQAWVAHSLMSFQRFEAYLVAYWALALREDPGSAGKVVTSLLHACDEKPFKILRKDLSKFTSVKESFYHELSQLIEDRNWLVHKSFQSFSQSRVQSIADRSNQLTRRLSSLLLERCKKEGMAESEIKARTEEVVEQWAADRNAA